MPCFHPRTVWRSPRHFSKTGKPRIFFKKPRMFYDTSFKDFKGRTPLEFYTPEEFQIPGCNPRCVGCIENSSRTWAVRCWHESRRHDRNCFITLTFSDSFLPSGGGLDHRFFQLFMKRFRRFVAETSGQAERVRFFMAGEYGSQFLRPHFHSCIFGYDFPDRVLWSVRDGVNLYTSEILSKLWSDPKTKESYGFSSVGDVTFESAAYVARYVVKKATKVAVNSGMQPEYCRMSLKPGIGKDWFLAYKDSVFPDDSVSLPGGGKCKPPKYYDRIYELTDPVEYAKTRQVRIDRAQLSPDNTPARLRAREVVKTAQIKQLRRSL